MREEISESGEVRLANQLSDLFQSYDGPAFRIRLWDGSEWHSAREPSVCMLVVNSPDVIATIGGSADEVTLGEAFIHKDLDVEGDLISAFSIAEYLMRRRHTLRQRAVEAVLASTVNLKRSLSHGLKHSMTRDQASISYHYDQPVEFYRPWLGKTLAYSCAYFRSGEEDLDTAQVQKLELICRKLRLRRGERFLDIGCGWGSLILHAAQRHGADAYGITLSEQQRAVADRRIRESRLDGRCKVEHRDYRNCEDLRESFDKIASIGMFEHVGLPNLPRYFSVVRRLLKPGGTFLNHGIARSCWSPPRKRSFIDRYVFPDGRLVTLTQAINAAECAGLEVRDVENLREHYDLTLRKWVDGLWQNRDELLKIVPETTYRIWLLYTAGCAAAFRRGDIAVNQLVLSRLDRGRSGSPLSREDWYAEEFRAEAEPEAVEQVPADCRFQ